MIDHDQHSGPKVLIEALGNSRGIMVKYLDDLSDESIVKLNILACVPLVYELDKDMKSTQNYYLGNPEAIKNDIEAIKIQGLQ